jgi:hypothetical protein
LALFALGLGLGLSFDDAVAQTREVRVPPSAEAWYVPSPTCDVPVLGCYPGGAVALPNPYPEGTLHVGLDGGVETARAYLTFDLGAAQADEVALGALLIPVGPPEDGTAGAELAGLRACVVNDDVAPAEGEPPSGSVTPTEPAFNCAVSSPARFEPTPEPGFVIDLAPFARPWSDDGPKSLVIVATEEAMAGGGTWHVAFDGAAGDRPVTAGVLAVTSRLAPTPVATPQASDAPALSPPPPPAIVDRPADIPIATSPAPAVEPPAPSVRRRAVPAVPIAGGPVAATVGHPMFLIPLVAAGLAVVIGRGLLSPMEP